MSESRKPVIGNALVWAAMIIAMSMLFGNAEKAEMILILMIPAWFATHVAINGGRISVAQELACIRRLFSRS